MGENRFAMRLAPLALVSLGLLVGSANCTSSSPSTGIVTRISPNAKPLSDAVAMQATVDRDQLVFPSAGNTDLAALQQGQILTSAFGEGFLRRVSSVDSSNPSSIVVHTEQASLEDVVEEGESSTTLDFASVSPEVWRSWPNVRPLDTGEPGFQVTLDGREIWANEALGVSVKITKGSLTIQNGLSFHAIASGQLAVDTQIEATCTKSLPQTTFQTELWRSPSFKVPMPAFGPIGVVVDASLVINGGVEISASGEIRVTAGASTSLNVEYGIRYENSAWQTVAASTPTWTSNGPTVTAQADIHALAYVSGGVDIGFFGGLNLLLWKAGAAGNVTFSVDPYVQYDYSSSNTPVWALRAGLRGRYSASLKVLGASVVDVSPPSVLFDTSSQVLPAEGASGDPPGSPGTCSDGTQDELETDTDCGGPIGQGGCPPCAAPGNGCVEDADCQSGGCANGACTKVLPSTCTNGTQDGDETGIDCGGSCLACVGASCSTGIDCQTGSCEPNGDSQGTLTCALDPACTNGVKDNGESDVDCGGPCAPTQPCSDGLVCAVPADCASLECTSGVCGEGPEGCYPTCEPDGGEGESDAGPGDDGAADEEDAGTD